MNLDRPTFLRLSFSVKKRLRPLRKRPTARSPPKEPANNVAEKLFNPEKLDKELIPLNLELTR